MCYSLFLNVNSEFFTIDGEDTEQASSVKLQLCSKVCIQILHAQSTMMYYILKQKYKDQL